MVNDLKGDTLIEQVVQFGVLYYLIPDGLEGISEDLEQIHSANNYSDINLVERLESHKIVNDTNLFPLFEDRVCDSEGFGKYGFISEFAIEVVAEVLEINSEDYEKAVLDFLDDDDHHESISIDNFIAIAKQIQENE